MLRKVRIILAAVFFAGITLLFLGIGARTWGWMASLQFLPAVLALNLAVIAAILLLTFLMGRIYCSVICPLGVFQDIVIALRRRMDKIFARRRALRRKSPWPVKRFSFSRERKWLRYTILALTVVAFIAGAQGAVALIAPYSAYGRMIRSITGIGSDAPAALITVGIATYIIIIIFSALWGRSWCNNICPVGTVLGSISRFSILRPHIDESKCAGCLSCGRKCKAGCIDMEHHTIDTSRCVDCFDCIDNCREGAIHFGVVRKVKTTRKAEATRDTDKIPEGMSRREFLSAAATITVATAVATNPVMAAAVKNSAGRKSPAPKQNATRRGRIVPPGAVSAEDFYSHCTACQLCVVSCPGKVLQPSTDAAHFLQPQMGYEKGFCDPECTLCSKICPSGAITPVDRDRKRTIHIGIARVDESSCIGCGKCASGCPSDAISINRNSNGRRLAIVDSQLCTGCGKCEFICPVRPVSAIVVDALETHTE